MQFRANSLFTSIVACKIFAGLIVSCRTVMSNSQALRLAPYILDTRSHLRPADRYRLSSFTQREGKLAGANVIPAKSSSGQAHRAQSGSRPRRMSYASPCPTQQGWQRRESPKRNQIMLSRAFLCPKMFKKLKERPSQTPRTASEPL